MNRNEFGHATKDFERNNVWFFTVQAFKRLCSTYKFIILQIQLPFCIIVFSLTYKHFFFSRSVFCTTSRWWSAWASSSRTPNRPSTTSSATSSLSDKNWIFKPTSLRIKRIKLHLKFHFLTNIKSLEWKLHSNIKSLRLNFICQQTSSID